MKVKEKNVPALRFPEFEGEWEKKKGIDITSKITKGSSPNWQGFQYQNSGVLFVTSENVRDGFLDISKPKFLPEEFHEKQKNSQLKYGDILINIVGASIGRCCLFLEKVPASTNQAVALFRTKEKVDFLFISLCYQHDRIQKVISGTQSESARPNLSLTDLRQLCFVCPSLPEQQKIASFLTAVDTKIEQLSKKKALLEQYKKGMMQKLFSQELRFKDEQGNEFPDWEEKRLGDVATFSKGKGISKDDISENGSLECIRYGQLYTDYAETIRDIKSRTNIPVNEAVLSEPNDIIIPASGETQIDIATASCVLKGGVALGGDLNIIRTEHDGVFISYYLNNNKKYEIARLAQGISVVHLYAAQLKLLQLNLPSILEQRKISSFLSSIDKKINLISTELTHAQTFKKGLLQQMFV